MGGRLSLTALALFVVAPWCKAQLCVESGCAVLGVTCCSPPNTVCHSVCESTCRILCAGPYDPCIDNETEAYFNRPDVQAALHANRSQHALPYGPWQGCSMIVQYSQ